MAVRERGAAFQADANVAGKRVRRDFSTRAEAEAWVAEQTAARLRSKVQPASPCPGSPDSASVPKSGRDGDKMRTIGEAFDRTFARHYAGTKYEKKLQQKADLILAFWGKDRPLEGIDQDAMDDLIGHLKARKLSGATINRYLAVVSKVLTFASARVGMVKPKIEREAEATGRVRWLSKKEETDLLFVLRHLGKDDHADAVTVLIDTGMRPGELWALEARDVDANTGAIRIWHNKTELPRSVYATPRVLAILKARVEATPKGRLFPYEDWWLRPTWDRARTHLGFEKDEHFIPYVCRHTCASRLVQRGVSLPVVMNWMGHKSMQMTMRYAHLAPANMKAAAEALAQTGD